MKLSTNFSLNEFFSPNDKGTTWKTRTPKAELITALEIIRAAVNKPVHIESGVRSVERNTAIGGAKSSAHLTGEAADIWVNGMSNKALGNVIRTLYTAGQLPNLAYTYLIVGTSNTRVHVGVDKGTKRSSIWGPGY